MAISEARRCETPAEVDDLGGGADMSAHGLGGAGRDEAPILDGEAFDQRGARIGGENLAVEEHQVRGLSGGMGCERRGHRSDQTDSPCSGSVAAEELRAHEALLPNANVSLSCSPD